MRKALTFFAATKIIKENDGAKDQIRDSSLLPVNDCMDSNVEVSNVMEEGCTLLKGKSSHHSGKLNLKIAEK